MTAEKKSRLIKGLLTGIIFGFLLQRGGVTRYNVIVGQLMLQDFTVVKIMLTAVITGMIGIYFLLDRGLVELSPKNHSLRQVIPGGLIFGVGFALLGYCPGTIAGAAGQGSLDALIPGFIGIILGSGIYARFHESFADILEKGAFERPTLPQRWNINHWKIIFPLAGLLLAMLLLLELRGF